MTDDRTENERMNEAIRGGRGTPEPEPEPEDTGEPAELSDREFVAASTAIRAGLDPEVWASRLRGDTPDALAEDARGIAQVIGRHQARAGGGFGGGARGTAGPVEDPSVEGQIRGQIAERRERAAELGHMHDENRRNNGGW